MFTPSPVGESETGVLFVKTDGRVVKINIADITYVEGMSEYLKIHFDGTDTEGRPQRPIIILFSMKRLEERLPDYFMRIHRSYLINLKKIQEVNKNRIIMDRDTYLPIGDLYRDAFNNYINQNFLGK
ncbi:MAG: LytTR family transcriptional regulator DNA-binding domain-containing protein [Prevotella sp.]|nr:LytTR family transcriptional regulator DNA-binding domain-containing protein [Prevotella sp.]